MYLTTTHQLLRLFSAELNKRIALRAAGDRTGIPAVRSGVRIQAGGQNISESQQGANHFYLLRSFLFNGYRGFFTGGH